jgi:hypothetical protein
MTFFFGHPLRMLSSFDLIQDRGAGVATFCAKTDVIAIVYSRQVLFTTAGDVRFLFWSIFGLAFSVLHKLVCFHEP